MTDSPAKFMLLLHDFQLSVEMLLLDQAPYLDFNISPINFLGGPLWSLISDIKRKQI